MKCNETQGKWCKNKHGASKIIDTLETYQPAGTRASAEIPVGGRLVWRRDLVEWWRVLIRDSQHQGMGQREVMHPVTGGGGRPASRSTDLPREEPHRGRGPPCVSCGWPAPCHSARQNMLGSSLGFPWTSSGCRCSRRW
jgi:hypothetical protein